MEFVKVTSTTLMAGAKYEIDGQQAFTEDHILIQNLYAYQLPEDATALQIREYFQQFGEVFKVRLLGKARSKRCLIYFADPKAAARALQKPCILFMDCIIRVEPCHSFNQPDGAKFIDILDRASKSAPIEKDQNALILTLNDDCLENICKELAPTDQINFALTCARFYNVMVMRSKVEYANLNTNIFYQWTLWRTRTFLQIVGGKVKNLETSSLSDDSIYKFLGSFCRNVEKLKVNECRNIDLLRKLTKKMNLLQEIELISVNFDNNFIQHSKRFKNLKSFSLDSNKLITGENIHLLNDLEKLSLARCEKIAPKHFKAICRNLTKLHYLDIRGCGVLKKEDYEHISEHLLQLKTLKIFTIYKNLNCIAKLPKLKHLEIEEAGNNTSIAEEFFKNLVKYQANQLEVLKLDICVLTRKMISLVAELKKLKVLECNCMEVDDEKFAIFSQLTELEEFVFWECSLITDQPVLQILENCLKLKHLDLKECRKLTPELIYNALKLLKDQRARSLRTCCVHMELYVDYSEDMDDAITSVENFPDILKITEEYDYDNYATMPGRDYDSDAFDYFGGYNYPHSSDYDSDY